MKTSLSIIWAALGVSFVTFGETSYAAGVPPAVGTTVKVKENKVDRVDSEDGLPGCTAISPLTGNFFDLRALTRSRNLEETDFHAKGYDYGHNFTMNICAPIVTVPGVVQGVANPDNVSAYYTTDSGEIISIGQSMSQPKFRGRRLVLEYTDGSPCEGSSTMRKSTLITMACDRELISELALNFVGQLNNCAYFFEARTPHACAKAGSKGGGADTLGPFGMFALIVGVMVLVYVLAVSRRRVPYVHSCVNGVFGWARRILGMNSDMSIPRSEKFSYGAK
ncbi:mannose-6-phosphate receptor binding domain-containing protein [Lipomyces arxii]|uniref:mannose-6-phosphate receptor binding domain-containing protein n=1 Tax=Lipomyces arxii TaxID=56418 RepID=UPI0034CEAFDE